MFGRRTKKMAEPDLPLRVSSITLLFDRVRAVQDPNDRHERFVDLWLTFAELAQEYGVTCVELELERDELADVFGQANHPEVLYVNALSLGLLRSRQALFALPEYLALPEHLKAQLLRKLIEQELGTEAIDPIELEPRHQLPFYELEQRSIPYEQWHEVLRVTYGISDWKDRQQMNPGTIYTPSFLGEGVSARRRK